MHAYVCTCVHVHLCVYVCTRYYALVYPFLKSRTSVAQESYIPQYLSGTKKSRTSVAQKSHVPQWHKKVTYHGGTKKSRTSVAQKTHVRQWHKNVTYLSGTRKSRTPVAQKSHVPPPDASSPPLVGLIPPDLSDTKGVELVCVRPPALELQEQGGRSNTGAL